MTRCAAASDTGAKADEQAGGDDDAEGTGQMGVGTPDERRDDHRQGDQPGDEGKPFAGVRPARPIDKPAQNARGPHDPAIHQQEQRASAADDKAADRPHDPVRLHELNSACAQGAVPFVLHTAP